MYSYNHAGLEEISTDRLRSHLRDVLDRVRIDGSRLIVLRRGRPVAGLVPHTEARALVEATAADRRHIEWQRQARQDQEDRLREAVQIQRDKWE